MTLIVWQFSFVFKSWLWTFACLKKENVKIDWHLQWENDRVTWHLSATCSEYPLIFCAFFTSFCWEEQALIDCCKSTVHVCHFILSDKFLTLKVSWYQISKKRAKSLPSIFFNSVRKFEDSDFTHFFEETTKGKTFWDKFTFKSCWRRGKV